MSAFRRATPVRPIHLKFLAAASIFEVMSTRPYVLYLWLASVALPLFAAEPPVTGSAAPVAPAAPRKTDPAAEELFQRSFRQDDVAALRLLAQARELQPEDVRVHYRIGYLYHKMNRRAEARAAYEKVVALDNCHDKALNNLGNLLASQNDTAGAAALYRQAIGCQPNFAPAHYNLANLYRTAARYDEAIAEYQRALALSPDHHRAHHNLALVYYGRARRAAETPPAPDSPVMVVRERPEYQAALAHFTRACTLKPGDALSHYNRGRLYELAEDLSLAHADYRRALQLLANESRFKADLRRHVRELEDRLRKARRAGSYTR